MLDKPLIRLHYSQGIRMVVIAKNFGVSRQRINQIVKNYKHTGIGSRKKLYDKVWKDICQGCYNEKSTALHHKDGDNSNEDLSNLIPLGNICHTKAHVILRQRNKIVKACIMCGGKIEILVQLLGRNKCDNCKRVEFRHQRNPNMKIITRQFQKLPNCVLCEKPFTKDNPYDIKNMHNNCYRIFLYNTDPKRRKSVKMSQHEYWEKNKEKLIIKNRINVRNYSRRHRKEINQKLRARYKNDPVYRKRLLDRSRQLFKKRYATDAKFRDHISERRKQKYIKKMLDI